MSTIIKIGYALIIIGTLAILYKLIKNSETEQNTTLPWEEFKTPKRTRRKNKKIKISDAINNPQKIINQVNKNEPYE